MDKIQINAAQLSISAVMTLLSQRFNMLLWLLMAFSVAMVLDFISGMIASAKEAIDNPTAAKKVLSSKTGLKGIIKKVGYMFLVGVAILVDFIIYKMSGYINVTPPIATFFSVMVTTWFLLNECLSIIENAGRMGVKSIPKFLTNIISVLKGTVEEKADIAESESGSDEN